MSEMENSSSPKLTASTASAEASTVSSSGNQMAVDDPTNSLPPPPLPAKKKRNQPGMPDPDAEVIALSPKSLLATNRFLCEICGKGFQRDQNLQLHRRGHNLPWKLRQRGTKEPRKRVYVCPEPTCVHHDPRRALGDLTGIKKHFCRKHGEKKWKCERCAKKYAVQSDWKAHMKICGTKEYKCDCGTVFSRRDSFVTHRAFCDALTQESVKVVQTSGDVNSGGETGAAASAGSFVQEMDATPAATSRSVSPGLQNQNPDLQETTETTALPCPTITSSSTMATIDNVAAFGSIFTPLSMLQQRHEEVPSFVTSTSDSQSYSVSCPIDRQPTSLSLSSSLYHQFSPFFLTHQQQQQQQQHLHAAASSQPTPMSATALLQKAAMMGAAATANANSLLSGYGLSTSGSEHHGNISNDLQQALGGIPSDGGVLFGSRPTTLDLLGLGPTSGGGGGGSTPPAAAAAGGLSALLNSFTNNTNEEQLYVSYGSSSWEGNDRKPNQIVQ